MPKPRESEIDHNTPADFCQNIKTREFHNRRRVGKRGSVQIADEGGDARRQAGPRRPGARRSSTGRDRRRAQLQSKGDKRRQTEATPPRATHVNHTTKAGSALADRNGRSVRPRVKRSGSHNRSNNTYTLPSMSAERHR
ncbi:hypothetical protein GN956_G19938 [Arapaima gigas]